MSAELERIEAMVERDVTKLLRDRLKAKGNAKPRRSEITAEFELFRQELIDAENARVVEIGRVDALKARIKLLKHGNSSASIIANAPNAAMVFRHIVQTNDTSLLQAIEAKDGELQLEADNQKSLDVDRKSAMNRLKALDLSGVDPLLKDIILVLRR